LRAVRFEPGPFNFYLLGSEPLIVLTFTMGGLAHVQEMARRLGSRPVTILVGFWWDIEQPHRARSLRREVSEIRRGFPNVEIHFLANTPGEQSLLSKLTSANVALVNATAFLDERLFNVIPGTAKDFAAIYDGRLGRYKRFELAAGVRQLAIITSPLGSTIDEDYLSSLRAQIPDACWLNFDSRWNYCRMSVHEVCQAVNRSRTGLMLSKLEGACYASGQYLLCGVPVVSTESRGGRSELFAEGTAHIVDETPSAVAAAVDGCGHWSAGPDEVRRITLRKMWEHRSRLFALVDRIRRRHGVSTSLESEWPTLFTNKLNYKCHPDEFVALTDEAQFRMALAVRHPATAGE